MQIGLEDTLWLCSFYFSSEWKLDIGLNKLNRAWVIALTFAKTNTVMFLLAFNIYPLELNMAIKPFVQTYVLSFNEIVWFLLWLLGNNDAIFCHAFLMPVRFCI